MPTYERWHYVLDKKHSIALYRLLLEPLPELGQLLAVML